MSVSDTAITRRGALAVGAGVVIGGLGLSRAAQAAPEGKPVKLTTAQRAGQRVIFSYPGATPPASLLDLIAAGQAGGVIFFG
jgi:beta-N-acetylhexosaminidase